MAGTVRMRGDVAQPALRVVGVCVHVRRAHGRHRRPRILQCGLPGAGKPLVGRVMKHFFITAVPSHFGIAVPGLLTAAAVLVLAGCQASSNTALMRYPRDLVIEASTGSLLPGRDNYALTITADGKGRF